MREKKPFGKRSHTEQREIRKKFLLVCEGTKTEVQYFEAIKSHRDSLGIAPLVDIQIVERLFSEENHSHPKAILEDLKTTFDAQTSGTISMRMLSDRICGFLREIWRSEKPELLVSKGNRRLETLQKRALAFCHEHRIEFDECVETEQAIQYAEELIDVLSNEHPVLMTLLNSGLEDFIEEKSIVYDKEIDKLCIVADRDAHSWKTDKYNQIVNRCKDLGYDLFITNPCIEFWLLMHFDSSQNFSEEEMLQNKKISSARNAPSYAENVLNRELMSCTGKGYDKGNLETEFFMNRVKTAIRNSKKWTSDIRELENHLGSRLGLLLESMQDTSAD